MKQFGRAIGLATELGLMMGLMAAGMVVVGLLAGRWIDAKLGTKPLATILLMVAGAGAGQVAIYRLALRSVGRLSLGDKHVLSARDTATAIGPALRVLALMAFLGVGGIALGAWLDRLAGTGVLFTLLCIVGSSIAGLIGSIQLVRSAHPVPLEKGNDACSSTRD